MGNWSERGERAGAWSVERGERRREGGVREWSGDGVGEEGGRSKRCFPFSMMGSRGQPLGKRRGVGLTEEEARGAGRAEEGASECA